MVEVDDLGRCRQIAEIYLDYGNLCRKEVFADKELTYKSKEEFSDLVSGLIRQIKGFIRRVLLVQSKISSMSEYHRKDVKELHEELKEIKAQFDYLPSISDRLPNIKSKLKKKLSSYDNTKKVKPIVNKQEVEKNIDSLLIEIEKKNEKLKELQDSKRISSKLIQKEFKELRKPMQYNTQHEHKEINTEFDKLTKETLQLANDNNLIRRNHSKLTQNINTLGSYY